MRRANPSPASHTVVAKEWEKTAQGCDRGAGSQLHCKKPSQEEIPIHVNGFSESDVGLKVATAFQLAPVLKLIMHVLPAIARY